MNLHCYEIKLGGYFGNRGISIANQHHENGPSVWKDFIKVIPLHIKTRYQTAWDGKRLRLNIERGWQRYMYWTIRWLFLPCVVISLFPIIMIWFYNHIYIILMSLLTAIYLDNHLQCLGSYGIFDFVTRFYPIDQIPGRFLVFFFLQRGRPRRNMCFNSKRRVNRRHFSAGNKIYCMFAIQFNEIRSVPIQSRRERRSPKYSRVAFWQKGHSCT